MCVCVCVRACVWSPQVCLPLQMCTNHALSPRRCSAERDSRCSPRWGPVCGLMMGWWWWDGAMMRFMNNLTSLASVSQLLLKSAHTSGLQQWTWSRWPSSVLLHIHSLLCDGWTVCCRAPWSVLVSVPIHVQVGGGGDTQWGRVTE